MLHTQQNVLFYTRQNQWTLTDTTKSVDLHTQHNKINRLTYTTKSVDVHTQQNQYLYTQQNQ